MTTPDTNARDHRRTRIAKFSGAPGVCPHDEAWSPFNARNVLFRYG
jgi:hypothetical protein